MSQPFIIPSHAYAAGTTPFGPFSVNAGFSQLELDLLRSAWPDTAGVEVISIEAIASFDGGTTWSGVLGVNPTFQCGWAGGVLPLDKFGQPQPNSIYRTPLDLRAVSQAWQIKGQVILQQPLTTTITITLS